MMRRLILKDGIHTEIIIFCNTKQNRYITTLFSALYKTYWPTFAIFSCQMIYGYQQKQYFKTTLHISSCEVISEITTTMYVAVYSVVRTV